MLISDIILIYSDNSHLPSFRIHKLRIACQLSYAQLSDSHFLTSSCRICQSQSHMHVPLDIGAFHKTHTHSGIKLLLGRPSFYTSNISSCHPNIIGYYMNCCMGCFVSHNFRQKWEIL